MWTLVVSLRKQSCLIGVGSVWVINISVIRPSKCLRLFFFFAADVTTVLLIRIVSSSLQNMTPNIFLRLSPYHCGTFVLFFSGTHTHKLNLNKHVCVCVQQYLRGSVCAHMECLRPHKCRPEEDLVDFILDLQLSTKDSNGKAFRSAALEEHRPHKNLSPVDPCRVCWIKTHDR